MSTIIYFILFVIGAVVAFAVAALPFFVWGIYNQVVLIRKQLEKQGK